MTPLSNDEPDRDRTCDPLIKSQLLYQLSYRPANAVENYTRRRGDVKRRGRAAAAGGFCSLPPLRFRVLARHLLGRNLLVNDGARGRVGEFRGEDEDCAGDRLHLLVVNLVGRVGGAVVVLVYAVEEEDDGDAVLRVVEVVAAVEESFGVVRLVVVEVIFKIEVSAVDRGVLVCKLVAHHARADDVN